MSTFKCTIEKLTILPHPNADALELAEVGLYRAVVPKGVYKTGDYAMYIPEQAILPPGLIKELGLEGKLAGKQANRVKAVRLRGELSQGIVCRPTAVYRLWFTEEKHDEPTYKPWAEFLGIEKWTPEIPVHMSGEIEPCPDLVRWIDIEHYQRYPKMFNRGERVVVTEKIHGTACLVTYIHDPANGGNAKVYVSSKGHGAKNLAIKPNPDNLYWRAVLHNLLPMKLQGMAMQEGACKIGLFGEIFGAGVQDLKYGHEAARDETLGFRAFDCWMEYDTPDEPGWVDAMDFKGLMLRNGIPQVPTVYSGGFIQDEIAAEVSGHTWVASADGRKLLDHMREGVVIRSATEQRSVYGGRKIAKWVSPEYLTRKGGTEYE
jgi:RNA ligase (TIGR02306 family)